MANPILVYGAYGYTGTLVSELAVNRQIPVVLAGRDAAQLAPLGERLGLDTRVFALDSMEEVEQGLDGMGAVLHCAGPFTETAGPMMAACLSRGVHYLDITGEIPVFETADSLDEQACAADVMVLPGAGFDVVPTDCLAAMLHEALPGAVRLTLAFSTTGEPSHGTKATALGRIGDGRAYRRDGQMLWDRGRPPELEVDFGHGPAPCIGIAWGDVYTAYTSTGIPNIDVYMGAPPAVRRFAKLAPWLAPILGSKAVAQFIRAQIPPGGPSAEERAGNHCLLWGRAENEAGEAAEMRLRTPDGYDLTARTALDMAWRAAQGMYSPGFQTPSLAHGPEYVLEIEGVEKL